MEGRHTNGGNLDGDHKCDGKSASNRQESDNSAGTHSKKGKPLHEMPECSHHLSNMNNASSSRHFQKRTAKLKGSSGYVRNEKGKIPKSESHSADVVGTKKYRTNHDRKQLSSQGSKWKRNRQREMKFKQKHMTNKMNKCSAKSELLPRNERLREKKESMHHSKSHKREKRGKVAVELEKNETGKKQEEGRAGHDHKQMSHDTTNQAGSSSSGVKQIPGFYYDHEKKRYFRLLPGQFHNDSWITSETMKEKKEDETRERLFKQENQPKTKDQKCISAVSILQSLQRGELSTEQYFRDSIDCRVRALNVHPSADYEDLLDFGSQFGISFLQLDRTQSKLLAVRRSSGTSQIFLGSVSTRKCSKKKLQFDWWRRVHTLDERKQIDRASLVNIREPDSSPDGDLNVLYSWTRSIYTGVQVLKCPTDDSDESDESDIGYSLSFQRDVIRSCSLCPNPRYLSYLCVGFSNGAVLLDTMADYDWLELLEREKNDIYSQVFAREQPLLFLGTKRGYIITYDLRLQPICYTMTHEELSSSFYHGSGVCSLRLLKDETYLLAGSFNGVIKLWDLRKKAVVKEMHGHDNAYKQIPIELDDTERFVYAVGQDNLTRIWSLDSCEHLKTIPYPHSLKNNSPTATMSLNWGGDGLPGMMLSGTDSKLYWYPF